MDMGFPCFWVNLIMKCVQSVSFSILINGNLTPSLYPKRGLKQSDMLSPYLFVLCADVLSGLILKSQERGALHGISIARETPEISHIFFADDSVLFFRANTKEAREVFNILNLYQIKSGQLLNQEKPEMSFSHNVCEETKVLVQDLLQVKEVESHAKYPGIPTFMGCSKRCIFDFLQTRIWKNLKGPKQKSLSMAGGGVLIKVVA